ncbi:protoporphyrinogen oxidase [Rothia sp. LK2588]|uniref:protoporphyrinogen oxidase n=1 Tax=Rothia sp. LK2588 TaxID=3114369 RepID=UPI0034CDB2B4
MTAQNQPRPSRESAIVIGGGIAGLLAARQLAQAGMKVTLVERRNHLGGAVGAHLVGKLVLDSGAESFATRTSAVSDLLTELGLGEKIVSPNPTGSWLYLPDGPHPAPKTGVLGIPGDLADPTVREILGRAGLRRAKFDKHLPASIGSSATTLGELVRVRMGQAALERLVTPVVLGVHATHPDTLELDSIAPGLREKMRETGSLATAAMMLRKASKAGSQVAGIAGGMNQLSEALVNDVIRLKVRILTGYDAIAIDRDPATGRWTLIQRQPEIGLKAAASSGKYIVLASDGPNCTRILGSHLPGAVVPQVGAGPEVALVTLVVDQPELDRFPRGTGLLVSEQVKSVRAKALTHATAKWEWIKDAAGPGRHVVRLSYGRASDDGPLQEVKLYDDQLIQLALHDAQKLLGVTLNRSHLIGADVVRWNGSLPTATPGHREKVNTFREALKDLPGVTAVGAWLAGNGLAAVTADTQRVIEEFIVTQRGEKTSASKDFTA